MQQRVLPIFILMLWASSLQNLSAQATELWFANQSGGPTGAGEIYSSDSLANNVDTVFAFSKINVKYSRSGLLLASNGKFYGTSYQGGENNHGAIYEYDPAMGKFNIKESFLSSTSGANPSGSLIEAPDGKLYGVTTSGGTSSYGVIYSYNPLTDTIIGRRNLVDIGLRGCYVELFLAGNGMMYALTYSGGANNSGGIFKYDYTNDSLWKIHDFQSSTGTNGYSGFVQANDGLLYSTTYAGGSSGYGVLFSLNPTNDIYAVKIQFSNSIYQRRVVGALTKASNGKLYGTSYYGGTTNYSKGSIFEYNPDSNTIYTKVVFDGTFGTYPRSSLYLGSDNKFYGTTYSGGANNYGVLYQYDYTTGAFSKKFDFDSKNGRYPMCAPVELDTTGVFYGTTYQGGIDYGVLYQYNSNNDSLNNIENFFHAKDGEKPNSVFVLTNGKVYGTTLSGGKNNMGVFFSFNPATQAYSKIVDFDGTNGKSPTGALILAANGKIYGTTQNGGSSQYGSIFEYNPQTNTFAHKKYFNNTNGRIPSGPIIQATDGHIYGVTYQGGYGYGTLFKYNITSDSITSVYSFGANNDGSPGYYPQKGLIQGSDGNLYGVTSYGGIGNNGTLFKYNIVSNTYTYANTPKPAYPLVQASNGKIYTTIYNGGTSGTGSILEYIPTSNTLSQVYSFNSSNSAYPKPGMVFSNGYLFGVVRNNSNLKDYIFRYDPDSSIVTQKLEFQQNLSTSAHLPVMIPLYGVPASGNSMATQVLTITSCGAYQSPAGNQYSTSGVYIDTLFSASGADTVFTTNLTVNNNPQIIFGSIPQSVCSNGTPITLSVTPTGGSFSGQGVTGSSFNPNMATTGTNLITYSIQDSSGCSATDSIFMTVKEAPMANAGSDQSTFNGGLVTLTGQVTGGSGNYSYQWGPTSKVVSSTSLNSSTTALSATTFFTLTVNDDSTGCNSTDSMTVNVSGNPLSLNLTSDKSAVCPGGQVTLSSGAAGGSGSYTYSWSSLPAGLVASNANVQVNPALATTYVVSIDDGASTITDSIQIQVYSLATASITGLSTSYCRNDNSVTLSGSPANGSFSGNGISNNSFDPFAASAGVHTIFYSGYDNNGCAFTDSVQTTVYNNPTASFTSPVNYDYCQNADSVLMMGSPAGGVFGGTGVIGDYFYPSQAQLGVNTMYYTYTDSNGCSGGDNIYMNILATPVVQITSGLDSSYCSNEADVQLYAFPSGGTFSGLGISGNTLDFSAGNTGQRGLVYSFTNTNGCSNSDSLNYTVYPAPTVQITALSSNSFCKGDAAESLSGLPIGGVFTIDGTMTSVFNPSVLNIGAKQIIYQYSDGNGCGNSDTLFAQIHSLPQVQITTFIDTVYCANDAVLSISALPAGGSFSGAVTTNSFDPSTALLGPNQIVYSYTDGNGCFSSDTTNTKVFGVPAVSFGALSDVCLNVNSVTLTGVSPSGGSFAGDGTLSNGSFLPSIAGVGNHTLTYNYVDSNGCNNSAQSNINVLSLPTSTFTAPATICLNDSALIAYTGNASLTATFNWNFDNGTINSGNGSGPYGIQWNAGGNKLVTLAVTDSGCTSSTISSLVNVMTTFSYITSVGSTTVCYGDSVTLFVNVAPGNAYQWYDTSGLLLGDTLSYFVAGQSGTYYCEVTPLNGCSQASNSIVVTIKPQMLAGFSMPATACINEMVSVSFTGTAPGNAVYNWNFGSATTASGSGSGPYSLIWNSDSIYNVELTLTEGNCSSETFDKDISIISTPAQITALGSLAFCDGNSVSLSANAGNYSYLWMYNGQHSGDTTAIVQAALGGSYKVHVTDLTNGCVGTSDSVSVTVNNTDFNLAFTANPVNFTLPPFNTQITNQTSNSSAYYWNWSFGDGANSTNISPSHQYSYDGTYTVGVVAQDIATGCFDTLVKTNYITCQGGNANPCSLDNSIGYAGSLVLCPSDTVKLFSKEHSLGVSYQWLKDGVLIGGATDSVYYAFTTGIYQVMLADTACSVFSQPLSVSLHTTIAPVIASYGQIQPCSNDSMELYVSTAFVSYQWSNGATTPNIYVKTSNSYLVTATDINGCNTTSQPFVVNASFLAAPEICIVGVDSVSNHNVIIWERQNSLAIDSFKVYKESSVAGIYDLIGTQPFNQSSLFEDTNSNTAAQSFRYRITAIDTCGIETAPGMFHRTIHLTINAGLNGSWNLLWNNYEGFNFGSYRIYRGSDSTNLQLLTQIQSTLNSYTDLAPPAGSVYYQIEVVSPHPCYPDSVYSKAKTNYNTSRSNQVNTTMAPNTGIVNASSGSLKMDLFPNPNKGRFTLRIENTTSKGLENYLIEIYDITGNRLYSESIKGNARVITDFHHESLSKGVYFLRLITQDNLLTTRFVVQ